MKQHDGAQRGPEDHLSGSEAQRLDTVINWGRHAEIFSCDSDTEVLSLENF
jgi:hypothetical protein